MFIYIAHLRLWKCGVSKWWSHPPKMASDVYLEMCFFIYKYFFSCFSLSHAFIIFSKYVLYKCLFILLKYLYTQNMFFRFYKNFPTWYQSHHDLKGLWILFLKCFYKCFHALIFTNKGQNMAWYLWQNIRNMILIYKCFLCSEILLWMLFTLPISTIMEEITHKYWYGCCIHYP